MVAVTLKPFIGMGEEEAQAAANVVRSGTISGFYGSPGPEFNGGPKVKEFESVWAKRFAVPYAISVNSATSGLLVALSAVGVKTDNEVIVPPLTMSATVAMPLAMGAKVVFADVEEATGCISVTAAKAALTPKTKAIIAVNLFGHPARLKELRQLSNKAGVFLIEDNAQGPLAKEGEHYAGTIGHIGVFSLNYHKHIHTGEGGMCVTHDAKLAERLRLIRNHGENADNIIGFNFRLTEIQAAIGLVQLGKLDDRLKFIHRAAHRLTAKLSDLPGLTPPVVRPNCQHAYYVWMARYDEKKTGISRAQLCQRLSEAGVPVMAGYVAPLYHLPIFNNWYPQGLCPVAERLTGQEWIGLEMCRYNWTDQAIDQVTEAFAYAARRR